MAPYGTNDMGHIDSDNGLLPEPANTKPLPELIML